jgi:hypothetical protein
MFVLCWLGWVGTGGEVTVVQNRITTTCNVHDTALLKSPSAPRPRKECYEVIPQKDANYGMFLFGNSKFWNITGNIHKRKAVLMKHPVEYTVAKCSNADIRVIRSKVCILVICPVQNWQLCRLCFFWSHICQPTKCTLLLHHTTSFYNKINPTFSVLQWNHHHGFKP